MHKVILLTIISYFSISANLLADNSACKERYEHAKDLCTQTKAVCLQVKVCKNLRTTCPQSILKMEGCEVFAQCMVNNSPSYYPSTCRYEWDGQPNEGQCSNRNRTEEKVSVICPGKNQPMSPYPDRNFTCSGHVKKIKESQRTCQEAIVDYHRKCMADISRKNLQVPECPSGEEPLPLPSQSITSQITSQVDVSRAYSNLASQYKKRTDGKQQPPASSSTISQ